MKGTSSDTYSGQQTQPKSAMRRILRPAKRLVHVMLQGLAFILRKTISFEKIIPAYGKILRGWGWVWQPVFSHKYMTNFYSNKEDPFNIDTPYEAAKYAHSLELLKARRFKRALEVGAAEGVFSEMLVPYCENLLAVDVAESAVERAQTRLSKFENAQAITAALPHEMPAGKFDLIVVSDILYYFPKDVLRDLIRCFEDALDPGGIIFSLHYLGDFGQSITGRDAHKLLLQSKAWQPIHDEAVSNVGPLNKGYTILMLQKSVLE